MWRKHIYFELLFQLVRDPELLTKQELKVHYLRVVSNILMEICFHYLELKHKIPWDMSIYVIVGIIKWFQNMTIKDCKLGSKLHVHE